LNLQKVKLFSDLTTEELEQIKWTARECVYPRGMTVFVKDQEADGLYIICAGLVKVMILYSDGREKTLAILGEGDILGEVTLYGSELRSASVETLAVTTFLIISREQFHSLLLAIPRLSFKVIELLSWRLRRANQQIEELAFLNARSKVICALIYLAEEHGREVGNETYVLLSLTHAELAKLAGVTRETVTKILGELQDKKLISVAKSNIKVTDLTLLRRELL